MNIKTELSGLSLMNIVTDNSKSWFMNECWNIVFQMNRKNFEVKFLDFPKLFFGEGKNYKWIAKWNEKFIYISNLSSIPLYIADTTQNHYIVMLPKQEDNDNYVVCEILQQDRFLYLFTNSKVFSVIEFNLETNEFVRKFSWENNDVYEKNQQFRWGNIGYYSGSIWSPMVGTNYIIEIKCDTFKSVIHQSTVGIQYKWAFIVNGGTYWALAVQGEKYDCMVTGDLLSNSNDKIISLSPYIKGRIITNLCVIKNTIWLLPGDDGNIIKIDLLQGSYKELQYPDAFRWIQGRRYKMGIRFTCIENRETSWILYPRTGNGILVVNKINDTITFYPLVMKMDKIYKKQIQDIKMENISKVSDNIDFFMILIKIDIRNCANDTSENLIGYNIYRKVQELL